MEDFFPGIDGSIATSHVLSSVFSSSDIGKITGGKRTFANFTRELRDLEISRLFTLGFVALINAILDFPMEQVPRKLRTDREIRTALLQPAGHASQACREL